MKNHIICSIEGCGKKSVTKKLCRRHYDLQPERMNKRIASNVAWRKRHPTYGMDYYRAHQKHIQALNRVRSEKKRRKEGRMTRAEFQQYRLEHPKSGFRGVRYHKGSNRYHAIFHHLGVSHSLKYWKTAVEAAKAYDVEAVIVLGDKAYPNFVTPYPAWVCTDCGTKYGKSMSTASTYHTGICGACGKEASVTEPRDYGYPDFPFQQRSSVQ